MFDSLNPAGDRHRAIRVVIGSLALLTLLACGSADSGASADGGRRTQPSREELPTGLAALLDSGTVAYRAGDYEAARHHYRAAADQAPEVASTWFGVYLAESALGNEAAADSALARYGELGGTTDMHHAPHGDTIPGAEEGQSGTVRTQPS